MADALGDRMKLLEGREAQKRSLTGLPVLIRVDGKGFSTWTRGLKYPFDERMEELRRITTKALVLQTGALIGYHQSDEITLVLYSSDPKSELYCDGRYQKLVSHTASLATAVWNENVPRVLPEKDGQKWALFDSRAWEVPSLEEAANALIWREQDASKNSVSMAARSVCSHKEIHGKNSSEMQELMFQRGINWDQYPVWAKRGTYTGRKTLGRKFTTEELEKLPPKHDARKNPDLVFERTSIEVLEMPIFSTVTNRVAVLRGAQPEGYRD